VRGRFPRTYRARQTPRIAESNSLLFPIISHSSSFCQSLRFAIFAFFHAFFDRSSAAYENFERLGMYAKLTQEAKDTPLLTSLKCRKIRKENVKSVIAN